MNRPNQHTFRHGALRKDVSPSLQGGVTRGSSAGDVLLRGSTFEAGPSHLQLDHSAAGIANTSHNSTRSHEGLDVRNIQTAKPIAPPTYDVPLHRQLATIQNADQARLIRSLNLCRETDRYQTFNSGWPLDSAPHGREMAASGWFYLGNLDRTQCFSCGGVLRNWRRLDNPNTEHISHFPHCAMAQGRESRNIPDINRQALPTNSSRPYDVTEQQRSDLRNMFPCEFPVTPSMTLIGDRVNTFNNWYFTQASPHAIAEAGMFHLGVRDRVKCFYCNGGLQNWRQDDDPWEEHAKWYPTCEFLLQQRGPEYIHTIVARFPNINRPTLHAPGQDVPPPPQLATQIHGGLECPSPSRSGAPQAGGNLELEQMEEDPLESAMKSEVTATVIGMGFEESLVRDVMQANIEVHGIGYQTASSLLEAVVAEQRTRDEDESKLAEEDLSNDDLNIYESSIEKSSSSMSKYATSSKLPSSFSQNDRSVLGRASSDRNRSRKTTNISQSNRRKYSVDAAKKLQQTLQQLKDERLCKVCLDKNADMVFVPCGHICCCMECTRALRICPICRTKLEKAVRTYTA